jgi:ubiquinone/menaquinone biosynthesis C-methylase UbiE
VEFVTIKEDTAESYDLVAKKYHQLFCNEMKQKEYDRLLLDRFAELFDKGSIICDMGCGPSGHIGRYLYDKGLNVFGIDISENCISIASEVNPQMYFEQGDITRLNMKDKSLDGIISYYSIIHTPKKYQEMHFREFNRTLKPGGKIIITVKRGESEGYTSDLLGYDTNIYFTHFVEDEIYKYLRDNNFKMLHLETREPYDFEINSYRIYAIGEKL